MNRTLPPTVQPYASSPLYTAKTVPDKLLSHHDLKAGTWGCLTVNEGQVRYFTEGGDAPVASLSAGGTVVICPEERHRIQVSGDAEFFIQFYK